MDLDKQGQVFPRAFSISSRGGEPENPTDIRPVGFLTFHLPPTTCAFFGNPNPTDPPIVGICVFMSPSHESFTRAPPTAQTGKIFSAISGKAFRWRLGDFALNFPLPSFEVGSMPIRFVDNVK